MVNRLDHLIILLSSCLKLFHLRKLLFTRIFANHQIPTEETVALPFLLAHYPTTTQAVIYQWMCLTLAVAGMPTLNQQMRSMLDYFLL